MIALAGITIETVDWSTFAPIANHLWQSTLFAAAAGLLALLLRKNRAQTRYWLWLIASAKFLIPFSLLISLGSHLGSAKSDRKSTRLNSSHSQISYAVFCL